MAIKNLTMNDVMAEYSEVNELLEKILEVLNIENEKTERLYQEAQYCQEHRYYVETKVLMEIAKQRSAIYIKFCNDVLGIYF